MHCRVGCEPRTPRTAQVPFDFEMGQSRRSVTYILVFRTRIFKACLRAVRKKRSDVSNLYICCRKRQQTIYIIKRTSSLCVIVCVLSRTDSHTVTCVCAYMCTYVQQAQTFCGDSESAFPSVCVTRRVTASKTGVCGDIFCTLP